MTTAQMRRDNVDSHGRAAWATGWTTFAAVMMVFGGVMAVFEGASAIAKDSIFTSSRNYSYNFNLTGWGVIHLVLGALIVLAGVSLLRGALWARTVGILLAGMSMVANFVWLPRYPFGAVVLIAIDVFIIWALASRSGREARS